MIRLLVSLMILTLASPAFAQSSGRPAPSLPTAVAVAGPAATPAPQTIPINNLGQRPLATVAPTAFQLDNEGNVMGVTCGGGFMPLQRVRPSQLVALEQAAGDAGVDCATAFSRVAFAAASAERLRSGTDDTVYANGTTFAAGQAAVTASYAENGLMPMGWGGAGWGGGWTQGVSNAYAFQAASGGASWQQPVVPTGPATKPQTTSTSRPAPKPTKATTSQPKPAASTTPPVDPAAARARLEQAARTADTAAGQ